MRIISAFAALVGMFFLLPLSCGNGTTDEPEGTETLESPYVSDEFKAYWYQGLAELNSYELTQSRYGELRDGNAMMIFVTEPFDPQEQVKRETPGNQISVLKVNHTRKFNTGIYPYSVMTSSFQEAETRKSLYPIKVTNSNQEWCGHTWTQLNSDTKGYALSQYSYFESEGDVEGKLKQSFLEDALWNQARMNPAKLPLGGIEIIPALYYLRFSHREIKPYDAVAKKSEDETHLIFTIEYKDIPRVLNIKIEKEFPHLIAEWSEENPQRPSLKTTGKLVHSELLPYWQLNQTADSVYREKFELD